MKPLILKKHNFFQETFVLKPILLNNNNKKMVNIFCSKYDLTTGRQSKAKMFFVEIPYESPLCIGIVFFYTLNSIGHCICFCEL